MLNGTNLNPRCPFVMEHRPFNAVRSRLNLLLHIIRKDPTNKQMKSTNLCYLLDGNERGRRPPPLLLGRRCFGDRGRDVAQVVLLGVVDEYVWLGHDAFTRVRLFGRGRRKAGVKVELVFNPITGNHFFDNYNCVCILCGIPLLVSTCSCGSSP